MANPIKVFLDAVLGKNLEDEKEIKRAEKLGEIVSNNAEISIGIRSKIHVDAEKARKTANEKVKKRDFFKEEQEM